MSDSGRKLMKSHKLLSNDVDKLYIKSKSATPFLFSLEILSTVKFQTAILDSELSNVKDDAIDKAQTLSKMYDVVHNTNSSIASVQGELPSEEDVVADLNTLLSRNFPLYDELQELIGKIDELSNEVTECQYDYFRVVAELLEEIRGKLPRFQQFSSLPTVEDSGSKLKVIEVEVRRQVQWSLRELGTLVPIVNTDFSEPLPTLEELQGTENRNVTQSYLLVNALGKDFRHEYVHTFSQMQLLPYERFFRHGTEFCGLEHIDKRLMWFRKLLKCADEVLIDIFPSAWCVQFSLYCEFIRRTKIHMKAVLGEMENSPMKAEPNVHIANIVQSLKVFLAFENEFKSSIEEKLSLLERLDDVEEGRYSDIMLKKECDSMSDAFDVYLTPYVMLERQQLNEMIQGLLREEDEEDVIKAKSDEEFYESDKQPYESAQRMFEYIKTSVKRCSALSNGVLLVSLSKEYRIALQEYCQSLKLRCPIPVAIDKDTNKALSYGDISMAKENVLFRLITTAEYCADILPQLEGVLKNAVKNCHEDEIMFEPQVNAFYDLVSYSLSILVLNVTNDFDSAFRSMRHNNIWAKEEYQVEDCSDYVREICGDLKAMICRKREFLSPAHFSIVCNKVAIFVLENFLDCLYKCKRKISVTSGSQLLLDCQSIKFCLLELPTYKLNVSEKGAKLLAYETVVVKHTTHIETICKLLCTDEEYMDDTVKALWPEATPEEVEALVKIKLNKNDILQGAGNAAQDVTHMVGELGSTVGNKVTGVFTGKTQVSARGGLASMGSVAFAAGRFLKQSAQAAADELKGLKNEADEDTLRRSAQKAPRSSRNRSRPSTKSHLRSHSSQDGSSTHSNDDSDNESVRSSGTTSSYASSTPFKASSPNPNDNSNLTPPPRQLDAKRGSVFGTFSNMFDTPNK